MVNYERKILWNDCIDDNKVLMIKQKQGFYGFPKGHIEEKETEIETAIRETKEETDIDVIIDSQMRFTMQYIINQNILKEVVYFIARPLNKKIVIQESELLDAFWIDINKVEELLTYENLKELWRKVLAKMDKI